MSKASGFPYLVTSKGVGEKSVDVSESAETYDTKALHTINAIVDHAKLLVDAKDHSI